MRAGRTANSPALPAPFCRAAFEPCRCAADAASGTSPGSPRVPPWCAAQGAGRGLPLSARRASLLRVLGESLQRSRCAVVRAVSLDNVLTKDPGARPQRTSRCRRAHSWARMCRDDQATLVETHRYENVCRGWRSRTAHDCPWRQLPGHRADPAGDRGRSARGHPLRVHS